MKTGKFFSLGHYKNIKIGYGTINHKNLKSIYLTLTTWVSPETNDDYEVILSNARRKTKQYIYDLDNDFFQKESIVDLDVKTKGVKINKRSFMCLEMTLFTKNHFDIKDIEIRSFINQISKTIINEILTEKFLFNFSKNKD